MEAVENAKKRGNKGQEKLLEKLKDKAFLDSQIAEITQQRNLYGRIDRLITFGADTASNAYKARFSAESKRLYDLLQKGDENALKATFSAEYEMLLSSIKEHLQRTKSQLEVLSERTLEDITK